MLLDRSGRVIASSDPGFALLLADDSGTDRVELPLFSELEDPILRAFSESVGNSITAGRSRFPSPAAAGWRGCRPCRYEPVGRISLVMVLPRDELLVDAIRTRNQSLLISLLLLVITVGLSVVISRHISGSLRTLASEAESIRELRFETSITSTSRIREVADLASTMEGMKGSIQQFMAISHALSAEKSHDRLLEMILEEARSVCRADAGAILLRTDDWRALEVSILQNAAVGEFYGGRGGSKPAFDLVPIDESRGWAASLSIEKRTVDEAAVVRIDDLSVLELQSAVANVKRLFGREGVPACSLLSAPLLTNQGEAIGVLQLVNPRGADGALRSFSNETIPYIEALCSNAAVALDNRRLLKAHKDLFESFIHVLAGAIDAKSPYTHGHCQRVPEIARLIAKAAHDADDGQFSDFALSDDEWYKLHLASWLHDCGKVTTPEYVVDKATKLETLGNRIHEIRTRFEVLWRDAEIVYWKAVSENGVGPEARSRLQHRRAELRDDFGFIARCNLGDTPPAGGYRKNRSNRVPALGPQLRRRPWTFPPRTLRPADAPPELPVVETLLSDKPEHVTARTSIRQGHHLRDRQQEHLQPARTTSTSTLPVLSPKRSASRSTSTSSRPCACSKGCRFHAS